MAAGRASAPGKRAGGGGGGGGRRRRRREKKLDAKAYNQRFYLGTYTVADKGRVSVEVPVAATGNTVHFLLELGGYHPSGGAGVTGAFNRLRLTAHFSRGLGAPPLDGPLPPEGPRGDPAARFYSLAGQFGNGRRKWKFVRVDSWPRTAVGGGASARAGGADFDACHRLDL